MAVTISEPCKEIVGGGQNAKYIKECKELYLGNKGIEKLRGFEPFVNLESLWLNGNKLKKLNNLDDQKRLKALYAQDNQICTLKGSLQCFKFLETLDLSNNLLRDLDKQLGVLEKFKFIKDLNLKGNPLCEEPDYRLLVVHRMPNLQVLDQHVITAAERRKAAGSIGGDVATLTVAFGKRAPPYDPAWDEKVPERSVLEQEMTKEAGTIRDTLRHEAYMRERGMFMHDPHPEPPRGSSLPPNAGTVRAMHVWRQQHPQSPGGGGQEDGLGDSGRRDGGGASSSGREATSRSGAPEQRDRQAGLGLTGRSGPAGASGRGQLDGGSMSLGATGKADAYAARDKLVLYSLRPGQDPLAGTSGLATTLSKQPTGTIRFEQEEYEQFLKQKAAGTPGWQMNKTVVQL